MATGGEGQTWTSKGDDFRHTCGLCMEPYQGRQPKILPCFHTFCLPCLTTLAISAATPPTTNNVNSAQEEKDSQSPTRKENGDDGDLVVFSCPTCRSPVTVPEGGVTSLQTNFYLDHEEKVAIPRPLPCDMCEEGSAPDATHACDKCQRRMCQACRRLHDKFFDPSVHRVRPVGPHDQPVPAHKPETINCPVHIDQPLVFYCRKCDVSICLHCKLTSHDGHKTEEMTVAARRAVADLKELQAKANQQVQVMGAYMDRLDTDRRELARQKQDVTCDVNARYDIIMQWASRARDEVVDEVATREQALSRELEAAMTTARAALQTFSQLNARAASVASSNPGAVSLREDFKSALLGDDALEEHRKRSSGEARSFFQLQSEASALELNLVRAYMGQLGDLQDGTVNDQNAVGMLRDLANKISGLESALTQLRTCTNDMDTRVQKISSDTAEMSSRMTNFETEVRHVVPKKDALQGMQSSGIYESFRGGGRHRPVTTIAHPPYTKKDVASSKIQQGGLSNDDACLQVNMVDYGESPVTFSQLDAGERHGHVQAIASPPSRSEDEVPVCLGGPSRQMSRKGRSANSKSSQLDYTWTYEEGEKHST